MPAGLDRAVTLRRYHWQVLGTLLTEAELDSLQPVRRHEQPARRGMNPGRAKPGHRDPHREN
jgi:hypothetical protein